MFFHHHFLHLELSKIYQSLSRTKQLHAFIIKTHLLDPFYATRIVRFYAINNDICAARNLFDKTPHRSVFLWNSIIRAYAQVHNFGEALSLFNTMLKTETKPDSFSYACIIRACSEDLNLDALRIVHGGVILSGLGLDPICSSALVTAYSKLGLVDEASRVFHGIVEPDLVMWNSMISGYGCCGFWDKGLELFSRMRSEGRRPDGYTVVGLLSGLAYSSLLSVGQGIHGFTLKTAFDSNAHVGSVLVSMYSRCKCMNSAYRVFCNLLQPDLVTWSALITGYSQSGDYERALSFFKKLNMKSKKADPILIASVLAAATQLVNVGPGSEIHGYVLRHGFESDLMVSSSLIDMYSKCGFVGLGIRVFEITPKRNIVSYNSVISGLGLHGLASQAFKVFEEILEKGLVPDESTFSALLCACCHAGLVRDGQEIFRKMIDEFQIQARTEHYVYMVKLFGMAGKLEEAYNLIQSLPEPVDCGIWGALLSCCDACGNSNLAEIVAQRLFEDNPEKNAYIIMLSNIYAADGRWDGVQKLRNDMTRGELRKIPGVSWIAGSSI
ncbi:putative pentatricopeptide repeat-containing protein At1g64310 [Corylus avellana]|uniref:putative pentatricopeptide repeat-containing protein At1g64310 n=1 Tax=Corylus avellana TaxID=13451 RepID=UPI00286B1DAC|nr:putative pentatricopeptide repeat-containing protein At1g64310 [Corylus avellana]XP_059440846.1 putative pentatricopeptide repeat-containing protein At1g64310 [Corylus avellana]XP_059440847.1 putative pentatricopeptide repeat-containing protein At1g64310 [Corylus avellana]XP_059440848.1 putative pentatricopeptide repeat-containing protein At1g64310 [Corylus avellana]XP_059440849.1 putative pentatricopeptide repeat-containing protein At1g64310 [Corylus avellana]